MCMDDVTMCHATDPRALIFRQQQGSVTDLASLQKLMGYNRFSSDFLSLNDSCNVSRAAARRSLLDTDATAAHVAL
jgi:hypothetical protein